MSDVGGPKGYPLQLDMGAQSLGTESAGKTLARGVRRAGGCTQTCTPKHIRVGVVGEKRRCQNFRRTGCGARALGWWQGALLKILGHPAGLQLMG